MATHSSVFAWRIPGMGEAGGLPSMGSHRVRHDWNDLAAAPATVFKIDWEKTKGEYGVWNKFSAFIICRLFDDGQCEVIPHCSFALHFSNNWPYGASFHVLDGKKPFFTGKKIKSKWQLLECLGSVSPHTRYGACSWHWLWPRKTKGSQSPAKSSDVVVMRKLETSPFVFRSWSFSPTMAIPWKSVFKSCQPFAIRQSDQVTSDSNVNLCSALEQLVSNSTPWPLPQ